MRTPKVPRLSKPLLISLLAFSLPLFFSVRPSSSATDKITAEEVVAKHLESIGTAQARAAVKTRIIAGNSLVVFRTEPKGQAAGRAVLASEGPRILIAMSFPSPVYPREHLGYDGDSFMAAFVTPGVRSMLGSFLMTHSQIFRQGLMGGTLSSAWPLLDMDSRRPRLESGGQKKVDNHMLYELKYLARGGSDLQVKLFFEQASFQHVRTEYERVVAAPTGDRAYTNIEEREIRYKLVEEFSDFKNEGGLTLPHNYKIKLLVDSKGGTFLADWEMTLNRFTFNEPIDPQSFTIARGRRM